MMEDSHLFKAIKERDLESIESLLKKNVNVNIANEDGDTPLGEAARDGQSNIVKLLLCHGADPDVQQHDGGYTPLMQAAVGGHIHVMRLLLEAGADPYQEDNEGFTALHHAYNDGQADAVDFIKAYVNCDVEQKKLNSKITNNDIRATAINF